MEKEILLKMLEAVEKDSWCQECGVYEACKFLLEWLPKYGIEVPEWVIEHVG